MTHAVASVRCRKHDRIFGGAHYDIRIAQSSAVEKSTQESTYALSPDPVFEGFGVAVATNMPVAIVVLTTVTVAPSTTVTIVVCTAADVVLMEEVCEL